MDENIEPVEINLESIEGKKLRVQQINLDINKLLEERDELEREIEYMADDLDSIE